MLPTWSLTLTELTLRSTPVLVQTHLLTLLPITLVWVVAHGVLRNARRVPSHQDHNKLGSGHVRMRTHSEYGLLLGPGEEDISWPGCSCGAGVIEVEYFGFCNDSPQFRKARFLMSICRLSLNDMQRIPQS